MSQTDAYFEKRIHKTASCWEWIGSRPARMRYGIACVDGKTRVAHRAFYEHSIGKVPAGLELDHLCRNRYCVNPSHLEPVTHKENVLRGISPSAIHAKKTHCVHGHKYTPENTLIYDGGRRRCRICTNKRNARYMRERKL